MQTEVPTSRFEDLEHVSSPLRLPTQVGAHIL